MKIKFYKNDSIRKWGVYLFDRAQGLGLWLGPVFVLVSVNEIGGRFPLVARFRRNRK